MSSIIEKSGVPGTAHSAAPFITSVAPVRSASRSVSVSATWDNCAASSPVLRSPNALVFATRLALVNQGLMAARDRAIAVSGARHPRPEADITHEFRLSHGTAVVSVRRLQRKCVLLVELESKTADEMAAVRAVIRSITDLLGGDREPVVAMQTGKLAA